MSNSLLSISDLSKFYRSHWTFQAVRAIENITFHLERGEAFGLLGHNGAGKTTTIKCLLGLVMPSSGTVIYEDKRLPNAAALRTIGFLPEQPYFYDHLSVEETLLFFGALHGLSGETLRTRVQEVTTQLELSSRLRSRIGTLSKGWQQRLGLAQAIINSPALLILDEPFSGLDPLSRRDVRELILDLKKQGTTLLLSSHILSDVEEICDRVAILKQGSLIKQLTLADIGKEFGAHVVVSAIGVASALLSSEFGEVEAHSFPEGNGCIIECDDLVSAQRAIDAIRKHGGSLVSIEQRRPSLEEVFVHVTTKEQHV